MPSIRGSYPRQAPWWEGEDFSVGRCRCVAPLEQKQGFADWRDRIPNTICIILDRLDLSLCIQFCSSLRDLEPLPVLIVRGLSHLYIYIY